ncbi:MAG: ribose-phosphate pyrophosphokinase [Anaerolineae bacterium]|nr:ribose-phosphate pyrophosphokinase [Anaerolineae bacterium]
MSAIDTPIGERFACGDLGIICMQGCCELGRQVDAHIVRDRRRRLREGGGPERLDHVEASYLVPVELPRFQTGDAKALLPQSARGRDLYILSDVGNYSCTYELFGRTVPMGPDEHFQDIKRVISAIAGHARRVSVIMPLLYSSRQHRRRARESLDCAMALQELERLGVANIVTFDAHDPRVENAVPLMGLENLSPLSGILDAFLERERDVRVDKDHLIVISPDTGAVERAITCGCALGLDVGLFYKRRDFSVVGGLNPIIFHEYMGPDVQGKDALIIDDIISSGGSVLDIAAELKRRGAARIFVAVTFGLFTEGIQRFEEFYQAGRLHAVYSTNLTYVRPELLYTGWHRTVDMSAFIAQVINRLNFDESISSLFDVVEHIRALSTIREPAAPAAQQSRKGEPV